MPNKDLRKKIGQLFLLGFEGRSLSSDLKDLLHKYHVGGVILFARNISEPVQAWELLRSFKSRDLLRAIDHEGGRVVRLGEPVTHFPPAASIGRTGAPELARRAGWHQARELAALGFNLNFAPVLDIATNPLNRVIGDRAFAADARAVARMAPAFAQGIREAGVVPCGKHFPGHGDTREDSHETLPRLNLDLATLQARELLPFQAAIKGGIPAIMTAHVVHESIDPALPATLSGKVVNEWLRNRLGFQGVVMSDDMEMRGITDHYEPDEAAIMALKAGVDMLLFCHTPARQIAAIEAVYKAVDGRIIKPERIVEAHARVEALKQVARNVPVAGTRDELMGILQDPETKAFAASLE